MQQNLKKVVAARPNNKQTLIESFCLSPPVYDITPPVPESHPKMIHYPLDPSRHYAHKLSSSFLYNMKPLLVGCDMSMPVDELVIFSQDHCQKEAILDEEDEMLINETIMNENYWKENKKEHEREKEIDKIRRVVGSRQEALEEQSQRDIPNKEHKQNQNMRGVDQSQQ